MDAYIQVTGNLCREEGRRDRSGGEKERGEEARRGEKGGKRMGEKRPDHHIEGEARDGRGRRKRAEGEMKGREEG